MASRHFILQHLLLLHPHTPVCLGFAASMALIPRVQSRGSYYFRSPVPRQLLYPQATRCCVFLHSCRRPIGRSCCVCGFVAQPDLVASVHAPPISIRLRPPSRQTELVRIVFPVSCPARLLWPIALSAKEFARVHSANWFDEYRGLPLIPSELRSTVDTLSFSGLYVFGTLFEHAGARVLTVWFCAIQEDKVRSSAKTMSSSHSHAVRPKKRYTRQPQEKCTISLCEPLTKGKAPLRMFPLQRKASSKMETTYPSTKSQNAAPHYTNKSFFVHTLCCQAMTSMLWFSFASYYRLVDPFAKHM